MLNPLLIARVQFAFSIAFHIIFPAFSIGLATFLFIFEGIWLKTKNPLYLSICKFWTKIFALTFGMGVVSGLVMEFQLGTNWSRFTYTFGPVLGSLFTYEVLTAFFIEAGFLGVMVLGWQRVGSKLHYFATTLTVIGVTLSAFWILSANSWMQHPDGAQLVGNQFVVNDWLKVIFNPLVWPRFLHMLLSAYITTAWVIVGVCSYYLLRQQHQAFASRCIHFLMPILLILVPLQIAIGDHVGLRIREYQPMKIAAIEAVWQTQKGAPLLLFAIPDQAAQRNLVEIGIPKLGSLINTHSLNGELQGLNSVAEADQPWVVGVFYSFRIMVGIGILMMILAITGCILQFKKRLTTTRWYLQICNYFAPAGFIAILTGWFTAEMGRQPWVVQDQLRTLIAASDISLHNLLISLILIIVIYGIVFGIFYFRYLGKIIKDGPAPSLDIEKPPFAYMETSTPER